MNKDEIWERLKGDGAKVYGQSMLDMFLKTTEKLERRHWDELDQKQRKLVNPEIRLRLASTVQEAESAAKDGAREFEGALRHAAGGGHLEICKWLAEKGARDFDAALYWAARGGHLEICKLLVGKGARNFNGALHHAAEGGHLETCKWLVEKGARDFDGALSHARDPAVRDFLLKAKERHEQR
jgi:hypothetical protein